jgi:hypothetical protein
MMLTIFKKKKKKSKINNKSKMKNLIPHNNPKNR